MKNSTEVLSAVTSYMKYARFMPDAGRREVWEETITRNKALHLKKWPHLKDEIETAYRFVYDKNILPSMRSLQFGGKPIELNPARGYNCCYTAIDFPRAFNEIMFLLLGGTGVRI